MNSKNDVGWYTKIPDSKHFQEFILDSRYHSKAYLGGFWIFLSNPQTHDINWIFENTKKLGSVLLLLAFEILHVLCK